MMLTSGRRPARSPSPTAPAFPTPISSSSSGRRPAPIGSATRWNATRKGFILTGSQAGADGLLETSVPRIYAAGDVRADSIKRCAIVGEGAAVVRFVHEHLAPAAVKPRA
jgi:hypothetical protein